jgi:hypothetical protein
MDMVGHRLFFCKFFFDFFGVCFNSRVVVIGIPSVNFCLRADKMSLEGCSLSEYAFSLGLIQWQEIRRLGVFRGGFLFPGTSVPSFDGGWYILLLATEQNLHDRNGIITMHLNREVLYPLEGILVVLLVVLVVVSSESEFVPPGIGDVGIETMVLLPVT